MKPTNRPVQFDLISCRYSNARPPFQKIFSDLQKQVVDKSLKPLEKSRDDHILYCDLSKVYGGLAV